MPDNVKKKMSEAKKCVDDAMAKCHINGCNDGSCSVENSESITFEE